MIAKYLFIGFFIFLLLYAIARPFSSAVSKLFLISASLVGILIVAGNEYTTLIANSIGIGRGSDLFLYLTLICSLLFVIYSLNRFTSLEEKVSKLAQKNALLDREIKDKELKN